MLVSERIERSSESVRACRCGFRLSETEVGGGWKSVSCGLGGRMGWRGCRGWGVEKIMYVVGPSGVVEGGGGGGMRARRVTGRLDVKVVLVWVVGCSCASLGRVSCDWEDSVCRGSRCARLAVVKCFQNGGGAGKGAWGVAGWF